MTHTTIPITGRSPEQLAENVVNAILNEERLVPEIGREMLGLYRQQIAENLGSGFQSHLPRGGTATLSPNAYDQSLHIGYRSVNIDTGSLPRDEHRAPTVAVFTDGLVDDPVDHANFGFAVDQGEQIDVINDEGFRMEGFDSTAPHRIPHHLNRGKRILIERPQEVRVPLQYGRSADLQQLPVRGYDFVASNAGVLVCRFTLQQSAKHLLS